MNATIRISPDLRTRADEFAKLKGVSFGWLVRVALNAYLNRHAARRKESAV